MEMKISIQPITQGAELLPYSTQATQLATLNAVAAMQQIQMAFPGRKIIAKHKIQQSFYGLGTMETEIYVLE